MTGTSVGITNTILGPGMHNELGHMKGNAIAVAVANSGAIRNPIKGTGGEGGAGGVGAGRSTAGEAGANENTGKIPVIDTSGGTGGAPIVSGSIFKSSMANLPLKTVTPTISILSPNNGENFTSNTITISGTASENTKKVEVKVDDGPWQLASGTTSWPKSLTKGDDDSSSPVVTHSEGVVYVGSENKNIYALNATNGSLKWKYTTGGYFYSSPAIFDGVIYVGSYDNNVYAIDAVNGSLK